MAIDQEVAEGVAHTTESPERRGLVKDDFWRYGLSLGLGTVIGVAALWLALRQVKFGETLGLVRQSEGGLILLAFGAVMAATVATLFRWQLMLQPHPTKLGRLTRVFLIAHLLNTLLPAKLGTAARIYLASESEQVNLGFVLGTVAAEKLLDTLALLILFLVLLPWMPLPPWLREALVVSTIAVVILFLALVGIQHLRQVLLGWIERIEGRLSWLGLRKFSAMLNGLIESSTLIFSRREALPLVVWTGIVWLAGGLANQLLVNAMGFHIDWSAAWFLLVVLQIGTRVPALPANIGVFHYLVILGLSLYAVNETAALSYAIVLHFLVFILPALLGALCLGQAGVSIGRVLSSREMYRLRWSGP